MCLFCFRYPRSHFFGPVADVLLFLGRKKKKRNPVTVYLSSYLDCTLYVTCSRKFSLVFDGGVYLTKERSGSSVHPPCVEMVLVFWGEHAKPASFHTILCTAPFVPC